MKPSEEDLATIADYVSGRLDDGRMIAFEIRLSKEPELAAALVSFAGMDHLSRAIAAPASRRHPLRFLRGGRGILLVAAAAVVLVLLAKTWPETGEDEARGFQAALVATGGNPAELNAALELTGEVANKLPEGFYGLRGDWEEREGFEVVPDAEYHAFVAPRQAELFREALGESASSIEGIDFAVVIDVQGTSWAIVLLIDPLGSTYGARGDELEIAYPAADPWTATSGRLEGSGIHVLPRLPFERHSAEETESPLYSYDPGFLLPAEVESLRVLVALRAEPLDQPLREELSRLLPDLRSGGEAGRRGESSPSTRLADWLRRTEFDVREFEVREPAGDR